MAEKRVTLYALKRRKFLEGNTRINDLVLLT